MKDLEGRVAVVAGATRGAGRSTTNSREGLGVANQRSPDFAEEFLFKPL